MLARPRTVGHAIEWQPTVPLTDLSAMTRDVAREIETAWRYAVSTSGFIGGEVVERFEGRWARYCGVNHAIGMANGTDAIELTLRAMGIGPGDEVIVPASTFIATVEGVVLAGATPRFVDVDPETLLVTPDTIAPAINERTAAAIVVHLYGNMPDMDEMCSFLQSRHLPLIEDAAQAHGSTWNGGKAGSFGLAGCFSFYPGKNLGAFGDAGAVVTGDPDLAGRIRSLANHGRAASSGYVHTMVGRNSRLDALQAGILSAKLQKLDTWNVRRRAAMAAYRRLLHSDRVRMVRSSSGSTFHQNVVLVRDRAQVQTRLRQLGIETGIHYPIPCHQQEPYTRFSIGALPVAEQAAAEVLSIPLFPHITREQVEYVSSVLNKLPENEPAHVG